MLDMTALFSVDMTVRWAWPDFSLRSKWGGGASLRCLALLDMTALFSVDMTALLFGVTALFSIDIIVETKIPNNCAVLPSNGNKNAE